MTNSGHSYTLLTGLGFVKNGTERAIYFFEDQIDKNLTDFLTGLVDTYLSPMKWGMTSCGKRCGSDHMSFTAAGYPAAFAFEGTFESEFHYYLIR